MAICRTLETGRMKPVGCWCNLRQALFCGAQGFGRELEMESSADQTTRKYVVPGARRAMPGWARKGLAQTLVCSRVEQEVASIAVRRG